MITKKPWFGPKYLGWGWRPITWQGWLSTLVWIAIFILAIRRYGENWVLVVVLIVVFCIFALITGGKPGSKLFG